MAHITAWVAKIKTLPQIHSTSPTPCGYILLAFAAHTASKPIQGFFLFNPLYVLALIFVKCSICLTIARITTTKALLIYNYFIMGLSIVSGFVTFVELLYICRPIATAWLKADGHCADDHIVISFAYFLSATSIVTDFSCSIMPTIILWNLQMDRRLKFAVGAILSFGFLYIYRLLQYC